MNKEKVVCNSNDKPNRPKYFLGIINFLAVIFTSLICFGSVLAQQPEVASEAQSYFLKDPPKAVSTCNCGSKQESEPEQLGTAHAVDDDQFAPALNFRVSEDENPNSNTFKPPYLKSDATKRIEEHQKTVAERELRPLGDETYPVIDDFGEAHDEEKFHWKPALTQSLYFLGIQHSLRLLQRKTVRELDGPFFRDWGESVRNLGRWRDGDSLFTNYIAHPMQGAVTGWIFIVNSDKSIKQEFGKSNEYWESRFKSMAWSAVWSVQFELGPISEASIGNVGLYDRVGPNTMGWVDLVVTPIAGTGLIVLEDMIDKYIIRNWLEKKLSSRTRIKLYRTFLNPVQSFVNVLGGKKPWRRKNR